MTPERFTTIQRVLSQRQPDLTVITDEVHKGRNLSAIVRSCDAVGINEFHCVIPSAGFRPYRGTALGSDKWVNTCMHKTVAEGIDALKCRGFRLVAANLSDRALDFREIDYTQPTALLMGTERKGVSQAALALCDAEVVIPMAGMVESYNVSVACAIILNEAQRQRQLAGMYDYCRLDAINYKSTLFEWCQPTVAKYCNDRGLDYPELDADGDIVEPSKWYAGIQHNT